MGAECCESKSNLKGLNGQLNNNNIQFAQTSKYKERPNTKVKEIKNVSEPQGDMNQKE